MRFVGIFCAVAVTAPSVLSASTLTLVSMSGSSHNEIGVNADGNPFLLEGDTRLATDNGFTASPGRIDTSTDYETPDAEDEEGPFPPYQIGSSEGYADLNTGKTGMAVNAESDTYDEAFISGANTGLAFGFLYEGDEDLVLPTGWLSLTVDGSWGGDDWDYTVASNAGFLGTVTTGSPYYIDEEVGAISGPRVDAVSGRANAHFATFFADAATDLDAGAGSSVSADASGFAFTLLADGMTVEDGQYLSFSFGHNISSGVEGTSAFVDALSTASIGLNVLGLAEVDTPNLGSVSWLNDAPDPGGSTVVPLPAAGWMLLAGLFGIASIKRRKKMDA
ncbi:VPLPA-CTERM sorting domain-containing protein [Roseovarius spongiae]|uniref:VPLPA-CTERM sorting domain-containing protein n=1 Tax=Roseovarius spongiae TaxID=2320272 RepID=A0A3A8AYJ6_9RHOB|nr:VPLPA-CTERM sorting domain-containing protein [Roseovarius spongiae]RKF16966.1 VPLPA-CTERM sorting domain-containing protein [Roseovarius spongiae]